MYAFYLPRGQKLEDLVNATRSEKLLYHEGMSKFYDFENEKIKDPFINSYIKSIIDIFIFT